MQAQGEGKILLIIKKDIGMFKYKMINNNCYNKAKFPIGKFFYLSYFSFYFDWQAIQLIKKICY